MANVRFDKFDNGNPAEQTMKARSPNIQFSAFDFSKVHCGNTMLGLFAPIDCFDVVPREHIEMSATALLEFRNPTYRQIMNGFRVYFHSRYMRSDNIWEGFHNFVDRGRSGNFDLQRPGLIYRSSVSEAGINYSANACTPMSLMNFLGIPPAVMQENVQTVTGTVKRTPLRQFQAAYTDTRPPAATVIRLNSSPTWLPAEPFFMYQKVWRDHYVNKNLLQNNKYWFPDNEDHFILSYSCISACAIYYEHENFGNNETEEVLSKRVTNLLGSVSASEEDESVTREPNNPLTSTRGNVTNVALSAPNLAGIKFVQFRGDRFTTANPFPDLIRGDIPAFSSQERLRVRSNQNSKQFVNGYFESGDAVAKKVSLSSSDLVDFTGWQAFVVSNPLASLDMSAVYTLETITAFKRKLGMTNGDYNEAIKAQFGESAHAYERSDTYIGGFYQDFSISAVTQQSASAKDTSPLGTKAGTGSSAGSGSLGSIDVPDYGWIQTYMFIVPDIYYTQGKPRMYSKKNFMDLYFPLFNNLPAQEIRNDELFIQGSEDVDSSPFAYEDRYAEYKSRVNQVSGFMGLSHSVAEFDSSRIMARRFTSAPSFNNQFITLVPENVDMEVFTVYDEPPFDFQVALNVRRVSPMPYMAIEGSLSSPALN